MKTRNTLKTKISLREIKVLFHIEHLLRYKTQKPNVLQTTRCPSNNPGGLERCVSGK